jgi:GntR family transcriptional regulator/MocR family aminotransferase
MRVAISIDRTSDVPLHRQVYEEWRRGILNGRFLTGRRVPSTRELATSLDVARATVATAYEQLIAEGYLEASQGSGTFVCRRLPEELLRARHAPAMRPHAETAIRLSRFGRKTAAQPEYAPPQVRTGWISFAQWRPDLREFPFALWQKLLTRQLRSGDPRIFDYTAAGEAHEALRQEIAAYVSRSRAVNADAGQVIVVNGSQQALDLCARLLLDPGDEVAIENPGYQGARQAFESCGARLRPVAVGADGERTA